MLKVSNKYFQVLEQIFTQDTTIDTREEFGIMLQRALELEHSTVPSYLSAAYSLNDINANNAPIRDLIIRVAKEEMLHMTVVANLMNAIGVPPKFANSQFMPDYPYTPSMLDMPDFMLHVKSFVQNDEVQSKKYIEDFFMRVESPETPAVFPIKPLFEAGGIEEDEKPKTIGLFYERVIDIIREDKIPGLFDNAKANEWKQIAIKSVEFPKGIVDPKFRNVDVDGDGNFKSYPMQPGYDLKITDKESAMKFLKWIVDEGEGTPKIDRGTFGIPEEEDLGNTDTNPIDTEGLAAHYYRFASIVNGRYLRIDHSYSPPYAYSGAPLIFDVSPDAVWEFDTDAKQTNYTGEVFTAVKDFNMTYSNMLRDLEKTFNASSENEMKAAYRNSIDKMIRLPRKAKAIKEAAKKAGIKGGLPFQYILPDPQP